MRLSRISLALTALRRGGPANSATAWYFGANGLEGTPWNDRTRTGLGTRIGPDGLVGYGAHNLLTESEFRNGVTDAPVHGGLVTATSLAGYAGAIAFSDDGSTTSFAYKSLSAVSGPYEFAVFVQMDDGGAAPSVSDLKLILQGNADQPLSAVLYAPGIYRVSANNGIAFNDFFGVLKQPAMSARTFKVTGYQLRYLPSPSDYVPTTSAARYLPRIEPQGLLVEGQATEETNSHSLASPQMVTQTITVTAAQRTFSFYGTGTVTMTGAHSATLVGTGAYPARTTLTFTPSAGSLTLTVSGTAQYPQLILGPVAQSYIPNPGTGTALRVADWTGPGVALTGAALAAAFPSGYGQNTMVLKFRKGASSGNEALFALSAGATFGTGNGLFLRLTGGTIATCGGNLTTVGDSGVVVDGVTLNTVAISWNTSITEMSMSVNGRTPVTLSSLDFTGSGTTAMILGSLTTGGAQTLISATFDTIQVKPGQYITGSALQALSA